MDRQSISDVLRLSWYPFSDEPLIHSVWYMRRLCDPCFLFPEESPDGKWHLFGHTWVGVEHFISVNGISWEPRKMIAVRGHSPFVFQHDGLWYLLYEKHDAPLPFGRGRRTSASERTSSSRFELRSSSDLIVFSEPKIILDSKDIPFAGDLLSRPRISRPQIIETDGGCSLFFGASHMVLADSGQKATRYFARADAPSLEGPYALANEGRPLLVPDPDDVYRNMACGAIKVIRVSDGFLAFECAFRWNGKRGKSETVMIQLESRDGLKWLPSQRSEILPTPERGWASRYVVSCDVRYKADEHCWYCYYSANGKGNALPVSESIGLLLGKSPIPRKVFL